MTTTLRQDPMAITVQTKQATLGATLPKAPATKIPGTSDFSMRLRGYDRNEVNAALGIMRARIAQLETELEAKPEIVLESSAPTPRQAEAPPRRRMTTWFEEQWTRGDDNQLDQAFNEFFIGADIVRSPWKKSRRRQRS